MCVIYQQVVILGDKQNVDTCVCLDFL